MLRETTLLLAAVLIAGSHAASDEPMVAFSCGYGAMHTEGGSWKTDLSTNCITDKNQILDYCKKSYPNLEVTNIVEDFEVVKISGWCKYGSKTCESPESIKIRPYRCLTGPFQSDSLTVPQKCLFDHIREASECQTFQFWQDKAAEACLLKSMRIKSSGMLLPCDTDKFTGVEFVCCPAEVVDKSKKESEKPEIPNPDNDGKTLAGLEKDDDIHKYVVMPEADYKDGEHSKFEKVKKELIAQNQAKLDKLKKDWQEANDKVEAMKKVDPKGAEKLSRDITPRFRQEYIAQQALGESKLLQLDAVHQQHVQTNFNNKKRTAAEKILKEIQKRKINEGKLEKFLEKYISLEEKDAHHCIQHYLKIRKRDPQASTPLLAVTTDHLTQIKQKIESVIELLDSLTDKEQSARLKERINDWLDRKYTKLDKTIRLLLEDGDKVAQLKPRKPVEPTLPFEESKPVEEEKKPSISVEVQAPEIPRLKQHDLPEVKVGVIHEPTKDIPENVDAKPVVPLIKMEPVEDFAEKTPDLVMNKMSANELSLDHQAVPVSHHKQSSVSGSVVWVIIGCVGGVLLVFTLVVVIINRRRAARYEQVSIDEKYSSPEEQCVATLQQNGFENPTYKFLERQQSV